MLPAAAAERLVEEWDLEQQAYVIHLTLRSDKVSGIMVSLSRVWQRLHVVCMNREST